MAIETYAFSKDRGVDYWNDITNAIDTNKIFDGYFDSVISTTAGYPTEVYLNFYVGENVAMKFHFSSMDITSDHDIDIYIYTSNGAEYHFNYGNGTHYIYRFTKTSNGVVINIATDDKKNDAIVVTKTDKGGIGFVTVKYPDNVDADSPMYCISYDDSLTVAEELVNLPAIVQSSNTTILSPIACCESPNGDYLPHCYLMRYSQYKSVPCTFMLNDTKYISNGYFCLGE